MTTQTFSLYTKDRLEEIEQNIQEKHEDLNKEAKDKGSYFGKQNLPGSKEPINNYVRPVIEGYRVVFQEAKRAIEKVSATVETSIDQLDDQITQWAEKAKTVHHEIGILEKQLPSDKSDYPWQIFPLVLLGAIFMIAAETGFNGVSFQVLGQSFLVSIVMAIGVSVAIVLLFHGFKKTLMWAKNPLQRWLIITGWIVFYTIVFYFLAALRQEYLEASGGNHEVSKLMFIIVNWLMLLATAFVLSKFPSWEAIQMKLKRSPIEKKLKEKRKEKERLDRELSEKKTQYRMLERDFQNMPKYEEGLRDLLGVMARKTVSDFLHENIQYRSDGNSNFGSFDPNDVLNTNLEIHQA